MASREEAKKAVLEVAESWGYLPDEEMDKLSPESQRRVRKALDAKDKKLGKSIKTVAQNLYASDARFVFELLQNADDNNFSRAKASGALPYISFQVYPDRIIVECNEDGFTVDNFKAICSIGDSTKSASYGYIGAKGIGFKSVFIAAWRVEIQSGHFSFYFEHPRNGSGLGMILPVWMEAQPDGQGPLTRMTLHLHQEGDPERLQHLRDTIFHQLEELQQTCLLFLRNLRQISVTFLNEEGELRVSNQFSVRNLDGHRVDLETVAKDQAGTAATDRKHYHVTKHQAKNLSRSEARLSSSSAEVILAFPLSSDSRPLLSSQDIFAFLPVRTSGFKFLIQSDFDTTANRQDILTGSMRNIDLLNVIAAAFVAAVLQFCEDPDLCYTWPVFLPSKDDALDAFWRKLPQMIQYLLSKKPILKSRRRLRLREIGEVVYLTADASDNQRNPLLDDPESDPFLSADYPPASIDPLYRYGLRDLNFKLFLDLLQMDFSSSRSRLKSALTDDAWHSKLSIYLGRILSRGNFEQKLRLEVFPMLPLWSGRWVSASRELFGPVYLPSTAGIAVPAGTGLKVIDPAAVANLDRQKLFVDLGVTEPAIRDVRASILKELRSSTQAVEVVRSRDYFHYLYLSHHHKEPREDLSGIFLYSRGGQVERPDVKDFYLLSDDPYGPNSLLAKTATAPGLPVTFVHPSFMENVPSPRNSKQKAWKRWLFEDVGVRERLRLVSRDGKSLSKEWTYVATHRPDKLLGMLECLWRYEGMKLRKGKLEDRISRLNAKQMCKGSTPQSSIALWKTWLPLAHLEQQYRHFMAEEEFFPFLGLPNSESQEHFLAKWVFLHTHIHVGKDDNTAFFLDILYWIKKANGDAITISRPGRVWALYVTIDARHLLCSQAEKEEEMKLIYDRFQFDGHILVPTHMGREARWAKSGDCLWEAPSSMETKHALKSVFAKRLDSEKMDLLTRFFQKTLSIKDATHRDLTNELASLRERDCNDFDRIIDLYKYLRKLNTDSSSGQLRDAFESECLIFVNRDGKGSWYKTSQCLWSSASEIRGYITINDHYEDLKDFFVEVLGVKVLNLKMVYDELSQATSDTPIEYLKSTVMTFNSLLESDTTDDGPDLKRELDPTRLLEAAVFPIRYPNGDKALVSGNVQFAIADRKHLTLQFRDRIKTLDYDLQDTRHLVPFFKWAGVERHYLSASVKQFTSVSGGEQRPISVRKHDLKLRAHAILRIAATYKSPRYQAHPADLYQLLRTARVVETTGISSVLRITQDGRAVDVEEAMGDHHITESNGDGGGSPGLPQLTVYVPMDRRSRNFCFVSALPKRLEDWLMRDATTQIRRYDKANPEALAALVQILSADAAIMDQVLDRIGAISVPIPNQDEQAPEDEEDKGERCSVDTGSSADIPYDSGISREAHEDGFSQAVMEIALRSGTASSSGYAPPIYAAQKEDELYGQLLGRVVKVAKAAAFPSKGMFDMSAFQDYLPSRDGVDAAANRFKSSSQWERDRKIGAAGELYVFELLSCLDPKLRGWDRNNWESTIRKYVTIHPDYADMEGWNGRETADLTYHDKEGDLTAHLADQGYLDPQDDGWRDARPKYFIEVKTTSGPCRTPFFMTKHQYSRMGDLHRRAQQGVRSEVYMVMRVFKIESSQPGVSVYLDPEELRLGGELDFTGEMWSVVPGRRRVFRGS